MSKMGNDIVGKAEQGLLEYNQQERQYEPAIPRLSDEELGELSIMDAMANLGALIDDFNKITIIRGNNED